jgi:hypothetical protein
VDIIWFHCDIWSRAKLIDMSVTVRRIRHGCLGRLGRVDGGVLHLAPTLFSILI